MKVTYKSLIVACAIITSSFIFYACQKGVNNSKKQSSVSVTNDMADGTVVCGFSQLDPLTAGQTIQMGTIEIGNTDDSLYVIYTATGGWHFQQLHLAVDCNDAGGDCTQIKSSDLAPGKFPYSVSFSASSIDSLPTTYKFSIPRTALGGCTCFCIYPHAAVVSLNADGTTNAQTAWGGAVQQIVNGKWYGGTSYCMQLCNGTGR